MHYITTKNSLIHREGDQMLRKLILILMLGISAFAGAQTWPVKSIKLIIPFPPGGGNDSLGRLIGQKLGDALGQPVVVDNRAGAGATIGTEVAAKSPADGYTLLFSSITTHALAPALYAKLGYDPIKDFVPVSVVALAPTVLVVGPHVKATSLPALIGLAKASPGKMTFASGGNGAAPHIAGELFKAVAGVDLLHIPFRGGGPASLAIMAGDVDMMFDTTASAMPHVKSGKLRALALATAARSPDYPSLPTFIEGGTNGYEFNSWYSLHAPAGTPKPIVDRLRAEIEAILKTPEMRSRIKAFGADPSNISGDAFAEFQQAELNKYTRLIKAANIKLE
ncbi:MAG: tripartite tricarboxylate transporter substrate binding protein [Polaromonas sp.]|nr:tripartite tricarboxylate transporter substrate binding protein [Polaromonas sp.]